jgi:DNA-binding response OmpR family regulator
VTDTDDPAACGRAPVLVIEDDDDIREVLRLVLEDAGYMVCEAHNGLIGLALLRESAEPLVVLVDWWMPRLDGKQVLRAAGREPRLARHAYALLTAACEGGWPEPGMPVLEGLMVPVLAKPFDIDAVVALVEGLQRRLRGARAAPLRQTRPLFENDDLLTNDEALSEQAAG